MERSEDRGPVPQLSRALSTMRTCGSQCPLTAWPPGPPLPPRPPQTLRQATESSAPSEATPGSPGESQEPSSRVLGGCPKPKSTIPHPRQAICAAGWQVRAGHKGMEGSGTTTLNGKKEPNTWAPQGAIRATHCSTPEATPPRRL